MVKSYAYESTCHKFALTSKILEHICNEYFIQDWDAKVLSDNAK